MTGMSTEVASRDRTKRLPGGLGCSIGRIAVCLAIVAGSLVAGTRPARADAATLAALINAERANAGLPPLTLSNTLSAVGQAESVAVDVAPGPEPGTSVSTSVKSGGFTWASIAENVAEGQVNEQEVMNAWMNSPGHRANILGDYTHFGAATSSAGALGGGSDVWVADFGAVANNGS